MAMDAENRPWIHLAGALGKLLRHLVEGRVSPSSPISIVTRGKLDSLATGLASKILLQNTTVLQCFDTVGWAPGRASSL